MAKRSSRNNILAGGLVLGSLLLAIATIIMIGDGLDNIARREYVVHFSLADGVAGLKRGSEVRVGGRRVGAVKSVEFLRANDEIQTIEVTIGIDSSITLRQGAEAELKTPILGANGLLNFESLGTGPAITGTPIPGRRAPMDFLDQAGVGPEERTRIQSMIKNAESASVRINEMSGKMNTLVEDFSGDPYQRFKEVLKLAEQYLSENRENVREAIASARSTFEGTDKTVAWLNQEIEARGRVMLDDAQAALQRGRLALEDVQKLLGENRPDIRTATANFRLASDQLRATLLEVRRSPWRLLYRPDLRELEFELLYDAARSYADAVSNLRGATEALEATVASGGDRINPDRQTIGDLVQQLDRARQRYTEAEQGFFELIIRRQAEPR